MNIRLLYPSALLILFLIAIILLIESPSASIKAQVQGVSELVSISNGGEQGNGDSSQSDISADGRYVAFSSLANNLVEDDTNGARDVFVNDTFTGEITRVSVASDGTEANSESAAPSISGDGRYVAFHSYATNLGEVGGSSADIYVHDRDTGNTFIASVSSSGANVGTTGPVRYPSISLDGRYIAFSSVADNLVANDTNGVRDVFVRDIVAMETIRVSVNSNGDEGNAAVRESPPAISGDGRFVAYVSFADNLVSNDTNGYADAFLYDRSTSTTTRVSVASDGEQGNQQTASSVGNSVAISADGRLIAFRSFASNLVSNDTNSFEDAFIHDRISGETVIVSISTNNVQANNAIESVEISPDGRYIIFHSLADSLIGDDTNEQSDIFVRDIQTNETTRVTISANGFDESNSLSWAGSISSGEVKISFTSDANNLISNDSNNSLDVFLVDANLPDQPIIDLSIVSVEAVQVIEGVDFLIRDKPTAIKVVIQKIGSGSVNDISVSVNHESTTLTSFFVYDGGNGSFLTLNNEDLPFDFQSNETTKTVYFFDDNLTPRDSTYIVSAVVDYNDKIQELDELNNEMGIAVPLPVYESSLGGNELYVHYIRGDWSDEIAFKDFYESSNEYLLGVYPISPMNFAPNKSDYIEIVTINSIFRGENGVFDRTGLANYLNLAAISLKVVHPTADKFIVSLPPDWFIKNTLFLDSKGNRLIVKGFATEYGWVAMVTGQDSPTLISAGGGKTTAHELAHLYKMYVPWEDFDKDHDLIPDPGIIGDRATSGLWVDKRFVVDALNRQIFSFMGASIGNVGYWINEEDYNCLFDIENCSTSSLNKPALDLQSEIAISKSILATGVIGSNNEVDLGDWYTLSSASQDFLKPGSYSFEFFDEGGATLYEESFDLSFVIAGAEMSEVPFAVTLPFIEGTKRMAIKFNDTILAEKLISDNSPEVEITPLNNPDGYTNEINLTWQANDLDGDNLTYLLAFSFDNGKTWEPLFGMFEANSHQWDISNLPAGSNYLVKVFVTDGFNTSEDVLDAPFTILEEVFLPIVLRD